MGKPKEERRTSLNVSDFLFKQIEANPEYGEKFYKLFLEMTLEGGNPKEEKKAEEKMKKWISELIDKDKKEKE